jgi:hypothetical protein
VGQISTHRGHSAVWDQSNSKARVARSSRKNQDSKGTLRLPEFPIRSAALRVKAQPFGRLRRPGHGLRLRPHDLIRRQSGRANQENADPSREPGLSVVLLICLWCPIRRWKAQSKRYDRKADARFRLGPGDQSQKFWSAAQEAEAAIHRQTQSPPTAGRERH